MRGFPPTLSSNLVALTALVVLTAGAPARADHGGPSAASVAELVYQLGERLDEVATEFGFEPGETPSFDERRFNRLLRQSRSSLDLAIRHIDRDQICAGFFKLTRSVSRLEDAADFGAAQNMSGWGFAEDLASLASSVAEFFLEDLIVLAGQEGADAASLGVAIEAEAAGDGLRAAEEWTAATEEFAAGVCALF